MTSPQEEEIKRFRELRCFPFSHVNPFISSLDLCDSWNKNTETKSIQVCEDLSWLNEHPKPDSDTINRRLRSRRRIEGGSKDWFVPKRKNRIFDCKIGISVS